MIYVPVSPCPDFLSALQVFHANDRMLRQGRDFLILSVFILHNHTAYIATSSLSKFLPTAHPIIHCSKIEPKYSYMFIMTRSL